jgi:signal transduction histidine kinase
MVKLRMRTKFLLSMLLISAGLTSTSLLVVRQRVQAQAKKGIFADLQNSVTTFQNFQRERELTLTHSAELLADMPNLRALMTTEDEATIQDGSSGLFQLAGNDLFVLADRTGHVVALHTATPGLTRDIAQDSLNASLTQPGPEHWWYGTQHLYEVFLKPIYFGAASENRQLGFLVIGYEIEDRVAAQVSRIAASQVAFYYGDKIVRSTLSPTQESELAQQHSAPLPAGVAQPEEVQLGDERFLGTSLELATNKSPSVRLTVLKSYDQATAFIDELNHLLLALGLAAILAGSLMVFVISHTFTRPLGNLVAGVRALGRGDFSYPLDAHGGDEVAEVTGAFNRMRDDLLKAQHELIEAERLATIGRMASSISHDLRHSLAAIVANAEFLCESRLTTDQREELYQEVRIAVNAMTDLIDSLLEFSRTRDSLRPTYGNVRETLERVIQSIRGRPEYHLLQVTITSVGNSIGWFDSRKLERVFYNLLLNACEAVAADRGHIEIDLQEITDGVMIRVSDNGHGIPETIRGRLFEPFVSYGKENGTGLGLTIVHKIVQDHGGNVTVEKTSDEGTVFKVVLPLTSSPNGTPESRGEHRPVPPPLARSKNLQTE